MAAREIVVLGTASQVPTLTRNHNGYLIRWEGAGILVDPGEGTQRQMLHANVSGADIDRLCLTHLHGDHCLGVPGVLDKRALDGRRDMLGYHFPAESAEAARLLCATSGPWGASFVAEGPVPATSAPAPLPDVPGGAPLPGGARLFAASLDHRIPAVGYRLVEPDGRSMIAEALAAAGVRGPDVGRLVRDGHLDTPNGRVHLDDVSVPRRGQSVAVVLDTRPCDAAVALARDVDVLVIESTYLDADAALAEEHGHLTARQAGAVAARAGARMLVLTHFSRRYGDAGQPFAAEAATEFDGPVHAASDLDVIALPPRRAGG